MCAKLLEVRRDKILSLQDRLAELEAEFDELLDDSEATAEDADSGSAPEPREIPTDTRPAVWPVGDRPADYDPEDRRGEPVPELYLPAEEKAKNQSEEAER